MADAPVERGECVKTGAGRLTARAVIHAAVMGQDLATSSRLIRLATGNALTLADRSHFESIAFPAFGTGVGGFPLDDCARIMIDAIREHSKKPTTLRVIRLVLFGRAAYDAFVAVATGQLGPSVPCGRSNRLRPCPRVPPPNALKSC